MHFIVNQQYLTISGRVNNFFPVRNLDGCYWSFSIQWVFVFHSGNQNNLAALYLWSFINKIIVISFRSGYFSIKINAFWHWKSKYCFMCDERFKHWKCFILRSIMLNLIKRGFLLIFIRNDVYCISLLLVVNIVCTLSN